MLTRIAEGVLVHQSDFIQSNAVVVEVDAGVLIVDPGISGDELAELANDIRALGRPVAAGFSTHPHWDHLLWHPDLGDVPRYGTAPCAAEIQSFLSRPDWRDDIADGLPPGIDVPLDLLGLISGLPAEAARLPWAGPRIRIIEHRAHAAGHAALLIEERGVLVAGDMLSDVLIPMFNFRAADPVGDYLAALTLMEAVVVDVEVFVPGHGSTGGPEELRARIDLDREYVMAIRDRRVPDDPRIGPSVKPGWEWVNDVHAGQARVISERR